MLGNLLFCAALLLAPLSSAAFAGALQEEAQETSEEQAIEAIHQHIADEDAEAALVAANDLVTELPESARAWGLLAFLMYAQGDAELGDSCLAHGKSLDEFAPEIVWVDVTMMSAEGPGDSAQATVLVEKALLVHPESTLLIQTLGDLMLAAGELDAAVMVYVSGLEHCTTSRQQVGLLLRTVRATMQGKQWELAENAITGVLQLQDESSHYASRCEARLEQGKFGAALEDVATLLGRDDIKSSPTRLQEAEGMREIVLERYTEAAGPLAPLCWLLRWLPGDAELERRIAEQVEAIRAAGPDHPYAQLVIPPVLEIPVSEDSESEEDDGLGLMRELEARSEAARALRVEIPTLLSERRTQVDDSVYSDTPALRGAGDWAGAETFLTEQLAIYPESRGYLERSLVKAHARDWPAALRDADIAEAMDALETSEDLNRDSIMGPDNTRLIHAHELAKVLRRLAAERPGALEMLVLECLAAQDEERWIDAYEGFALAQEMKPDGDGFFTARMKGQLLGAHRAQIAAAYVALGTAALEAGNVSEAQRIDEIVSWNFAGHVFVYSFTARLAREMQDFERMEQELIRLLTYEAFNAEAHYLLGLLAKEREDIGRALLHFNAGAGPMNDLDEIAALSGFAGDCAEQRARLELQIAPDEGYALYAEATNAALSSVEAPGALAIAGLTRLVEMGGSRSQLISFRCVRYLGLNEYESALADADLVLAESAATEDEIRSATDGRAIALRSLGRFKESAEAYGRYAELEPQDARPREQQGFALQQAGDIEAAVLAFQQAIELGSRDAYVYMELAECHALLGHWSDATEAASEACSLASDDNNLMLGVRASNAAQKWLAKSFEELFGE